MWPFFTDNKHFATYGIGIYLYLSFVKKLTIIFFLMSLLQIPTIVQNVDFGIDDDNPDDNNFYKYIKRLSIGNRPHLNLDQSYFEEADRENPDMIFDQNVEYLASASSMDILTTALFILFVFWIQDHH